MAFEVNTYRKYVEDKSLDNSLFTEMYEEVRGLIEEEEVESIIIKFSKKLSIEKARKVINTGKPIIEGPNDSIVIDKEYAYEILKESHLKYVAADVYDYFTLKDSAPNESVKLYINRLTFNVEEEKRRVFLRHKKTIKEQNRRIELFLDGKIKQEELPNYKFKKKNTKVNTIEMIDSDKPIYKKGWNKTVK